MADAPVQADAAPHGYTLPDCAALYRGAAKQSVRCACCGEQRQLVVGHGDRYGFGIRTVVCARCALIYTSPRPSNEWFAEFYRRYYRSVYECMEEPDADYLERDWIRGRHSRSLDFLNPWLPPSGHLLDVGCAEGTFLHLFRERFPGWQLSGIEPSETFSQFARAHYGLAGVKTARFEQLESLPPGSFSVVTASHVLEHLLDPGKFLKIVHRLLQPEGLLYIDVPNAAGQAPGIGNLHIAHVYHFADYSLRNLLTKFGFDILLLRSGLESPSWTLQALARKEATDRSPWQPRAVRPEQVVRSFRQYGELSWRRRLLRHVRRELSHALRKVRRDGRAKGREIDS